MLSDSEWEKQMEEVIAKKENENGRVAASHVHKETKVSTSTTIAIIVLLLLLVSSCLCALLLVLLPFVISAPIAGGLLAILLLGILYLR